MEEKQIDFPEENVRRELSGLLKEKPKTISRFAIRSKVLGILKETNYPLTVNNIVEFNVGDDSDDLSKKVNKIMIEKGYLPASDNYIKSY